MIDLTANEKKLLSLACAEEIEYHKHVHVTPIVGGGKSDINDRTAAVLYEATEKLIKQYMTYRELIIESVKKNSPLPPEIEQKWLITLCRDHLQSVQKYVVVKQQFNGTVSEKRVFAPVRDLMIETRNMYMQKYKDLIRKLGGDPSPSEGQMLSFEPM